MTQRDSNMELRRNELLEDVQAHAKRVLVDHGVDEAVAEQAGCAISDHLAESWGGQYVTIPKDYHFRVAERDLLIYEEFDGRNHNALAKKWRMTTRGIYKVLQRVRAKGDPNQPRLPF